MQCCLLQEQSEFTVDILEDFTTVNNLQTVLSVSC